MFERAPGEKGGRVRRRGGWSAGGLPPTGPPRYDLLGSGLRWIEPRRCDSNCAPAGFDTRSAYGLPCRVECEKRLSMSTGCERSNTPLGASLRRELAGRGRLRASLRRKRAGGLRLGPACDTNLLGGGGSCEPAEAAHSRRECE